MSQLQETLTLATQLQQSGRIAEAETLYQQILALHPNHPHTHYLVGTLAAQRGQLDRAVTSIRRALQLAPNEPAYHQNLGILLLAAGRPVEAADAHRAAIALRPGYAEAHLHLALALKSLRQFPEAADILHEALRLNPNLAAAHVNLGNVLQDLRQPEAAIASYKTALVLRPTMLEALINLSHALTTLGRYDDAIAAARQALTLNPNLAEAHANIATPLARTGLVADAIAALHKSLALRPNQITIHDALLVTLNYDPASTPEFLAAAARNWATQWAPAAPTPISHPIDRSPDRRLRIGYVSADFRDHVSRHFIQPLLANHNTHNVELFCYSQVPTHQEDTATRHFQSLAHHWRPAADLPDAALAQQIRDDHIDILVDLMLHNPGNRLPVFSQKPAPVQVSWLAYPGTTGLPQIDYRFTDPYLDPPDRPNPSSERPCRLPTFWCYDPLTASPADPPTNPLPALTNGHLTFGCLNDFCKINPHVLSLWADLLRQLPTARLHLLCPEGLSRDRTRAFFESRNIAPNRVTFLSRLPRTDYLHLHHAIDIALDPFPYNGHTTSLDALYMGVPILSLLTPTIVGRASLSQLSQIGLTNLIATTSADFLRIATGLSADLPRLSHLRQTLRETLRASPLMNAPVFAQAVESAYRDMWRQYIST
jgi:predicted O-linked N-acetylglucosamine transferase (SPINDLY family)